MSKVSTIYDAVIAKMVSLYPSKLRLPNPYELSDNTEICSRDSWGIKVGEAERQDQEFCNLTVSRSFTAVFTRQYVTLGNKSDGYDTVSKSILEDQQTFLNSFWSPDQLGVEDIVDMIDFDSISGIQHRVDNESRYLFCEVGFKITISERVI